MSSGSTGPRVRIGDAERDVAASALGEHFAAGRLSREEFDERLERAWAAKTGDDLDPLFLDLPRADDGRQQLSASRVDGPLRRTAWAKVGPRRTPFGLPPPLAIVLAVVLLITIITHLPFILFVLGVLWFFGVIGHRRRYDGQWAQHRPPWARG